MPEGPEVETVRRSLVPLLVGQTLGKARVSSLPLRTPVTTRALAFLEGRRVVALGRHGKLLWIDVEGDAGLLVRLGMTGQLLVQPKVQTPLPHTHVTVPLTSTPNATDAAPLELRYVDPRRFGLVTPYPNAAAREAERARMGPDLIALDDDGRGVLRHKLKKTARALKDVLLDQTVFAGVGNIYAAEALFVARLSPFRLASTLKGAEAERLIEAVREVLVLAVERRGTSFSNYVDGTGAPGENFLHLHVFQREGEACRVCGQAVRRLVQGQRSTFFCARCQKVRGL